MAKKHTKKILTSLIFTALGLYFTYILFRGTDWAEVLEIIKGANLFWLTASFICIMIAYFVQGTRAIFIFKHTKPITIWQALSTNWIFIFWRQMVPIRGGNLVRAFLFSRSTRLPFSRTFGIATVDQIPEIIFFFIILAITMYVVPADMEIRINPDVFKTEEEMVFSGSAIRSAAVVIATLAGLSTCFLLALYFRKDTFPARVGRFVGKINSKKAPEAVEQSLRNFSESMHVIHHKRDMFFHILFSGAYFFFIILSLGFNFYAFDIWMGWDGVIVAFTLICIVVVLPGTPGVVGQYHAAVVFTLIAFMPGMSGEEMKAVAIFSHAMQLLVLAIPAIIFILVDHVNIGTLDNLDREELMEQK